MELQVDGYTAKVEPCDGGELRGEIVLPGGHGCDAYGSTLVQLETELRTSLRILLEELGRERNEVGV